MKSLQLYTHYLETRPFLTKTLSSCFVFAFGDYICQKLEHKYISEKDNNSIDWFRVLRQSAFCVLCTPLLHLQYNKIIPYLFPEKSKHSVLKSVAYAVTISDGSLNFLFFLYMAIINGHSLKDGMDDIMKKFIPVQINNIKFWPLLSWVNFTFVPPNYRVLFDNIMCILWNTYLSYVENTQFLMRLPEEKHIKIV